MQPEMTMRDHFAAAALTGLLAQGDDGSFSEESYARAAYRWADAMLRERERTNHDAAPAARGDARECAAPVTTGGTRESLSGSLPADLGDGVSPSENDKNLHHTQEIAAYALFAGMVMDWISEATSAYAASCSSDGGRKIMAEACSRCLDAFDRIAHPTGHGAAPAARASVESVVPQPTTHGDSDRTDNAAPRPSEGTGDTPEPHATPGEGSVPREGTQEPVAWGVAGLGGVLATSISRRDAVDMQGDYEFVTEVVPLYRQASDFAPPPPDNAEPVAWAVMLEDGERIYDVYAIEEEAKAVDEAVTGNHGIVPLYRSPTLTDAERDLLDTLRRSGHLLPHGAQIIDGLLERLGGGR